MFARIIKFAFLAIFIIIVISFVIEIISNTPACVLKNLIKKGTLDSQKLTLKINYLLFIPVGEAKLEILGKERFRNADLVHIRAQAKTFDFVKSIFHAKATVDSYIDPVQLHSVYFIQHLEMINKPDENKELSYDQKRHIMTYQGPRGSEKRVVDEHAQDPLSAVFFIQNKKFKIGDSFKLSLNTNQKNYVVSVNVISKQIVKISDKDYEIWLTQSSVSRKDKNPRHKSSYKAWFLVYNNINSPILIKAMTNIGPVVAKAE